MDAAQDIDSNGRLPRRSMRCLVRLGGFLLVATNKRQPVRLLPLGRRARSVKPRIGRLPWTTQGGDNLRSGIRSEGISEGHGQTLPDKKKYAMQKKELALCLQCGQSKRMSNNENIKLSRKHNHNGVRFGYSKKHGWMLHYSCAIGCGWIPCVPSHMK